MNKIFAFSLLLFAAGSFVACSNEEDDLFSQSAAERLNAAKTTYSDILTSSKGGWAMEYYCTNDTLGDNGASDFKSVGYLLGAKFSTDGTVTMGMKNIFSGNTYISDKSLWDIITDDGPVLSFDSYNRVIHSFADPANLPASISGGEVDVTGQGAEGDFEFVLTNMKADEELATVKGKKRGTYIRMTRLPEGTDFKEYLAECDSFRTAVFGSSDFSAPVMHLGNSNICIKSPDVTSTPKLYPFHGDSILTMYRRPFLITKRDGNFYLRFKSEFSLASDTACQEFKFDNATQKFTGVGEGRENWTIAPYDVFTFYNDKFADGSWVFQLNDGKSDALQALFTNFNNALVKLGFAVQSNRFILGKTKDGYTLSLSVRNKKNQSSTLVYNFTGSTDNNKFTLTYSEPATSVSSTFLNNLPVLGDLLQGLNGTYTVTPAISVWNLHSLKLTDGDKYLTTSFM